MHGHHTTAQCYCSVYTMLPTMQSQNEHNSWVNKHPQSKKQKNWLIWKKKLNSVAQTWFGFWMSNKLLHSVSCKMCQEVLLKSGKHPICSCYELSVCMKMKCCKSLSPLLKTSMAILAKTTQENNRIQFSTPPSLLTFAVAPTQRVNKLMLNVEWHRSALDITIPAANVFFERGSNKTTFLK